MLMARYNGSPDVTFARKGEARPTGTATAGAPIPFPVRPLPLGDGHDRRSTGDAGPDEPLSRIPLAMLIQRSTVTPIQAPPPAVTPIQAAPAAPARGVVTPSESANIGDATTVDLHLLTRPSAPGGKHGPRASMATPRRQLTFRLRFEDYRALADLRNGTATTFQALLERAALALIRRSVRD